MSQFIIQGGNKISGEISVAGAKNNALKAIPATLLTDEVCIIRNVPQVGGLDDILKLMENVGSKIERVDDHTYQIDNSNVNKTDLSDNLVKKERSSLMLIAPLLARFNKVNIVHPGGCVLGKRPIDLFLDLFESFGAEVSSASENCYSFIAKKGLRATTYTFPIMSHTGTESAILIASLTLGTSKIINAACEPEVVALADMLNAMGAKISGAGTPFITIEGVEKLHGIDWTIIPDRLEAGTFLIMAAALQSELVVKNCEPKHLDVPLKILKKIGIPLEIGEDFIHVQPAKNLQATDITTHEYPGFPTDLQAPMTVLLTQAQGVSLIHETIFERRMFYIDSLNKMGAHIILCDPHRAVVNGPKQLYGTSLISPDIRAGMALLIAALMASGTTKIDNIEQIERGYENIVERLTALGVKIQRID